MGRQTFWDLWLSGLCTGIPVTDPELDPGHKLVLSHFFFLFRPVLTEDLTIISRIRSTENTCTHIPEWYIFLQK